MKTLQTILFILAFLGVSIGAEAVETWYTPSGPSYEIHTSTRVAKKGKKSAFYIVTYKTKTNLDDQYGLLQEYYDLLAHLYYFVIPKNVRNDEHSIVTLEAFNEPSKSTDKAPPSRRFSKKLSEIKKIVKNHKTIDSNRVKGLQALHKNKLKESIKYFKKIKQHVPNDYVHIANAYLYDGKRKEALKEFEEGHKKFPKDVTLINNLAMTTMIMGTFYLEEKYEYDPQQIEKAKNILAKAQKIDATNWLTLSNMAVLETSIKNYKAAEKLYDKALTLSQNRRQLLFQVADFYHRRKLFKKAKKHYEKMLKSVEGDRAIAAENIRSGIIKNIKARLKLVREKKLPN